jgi:serine/threonine-protein kinase
MRRCPLTGRALGGDTRLIGQLIDKRYRIVRLLGDGPFGAVYKAEHVTVGRQVALRVLPSSLLAHPVVLNRFFREARLMSSVNHARLQPLLDAGLSAEGVAYVAYQYVRGRSLAAALARDAPFPVAVAATLICQVLEGLEAIHQSGFVHRALAPESVLLQITARGAEHALLTNFGAAALEVDRSRPATLGAAQDAAISPSVFVPSLFIPPERTRGAPPDRREDIFAAGVMFAACLSSAGVPRSASELVAQNVPPPVEAIIARATQQSPSGRFSSAADMLSALRPYGVVDEEEPASATKTHISDLRALSRRERALGTLPSRVRLSDIEMRSESQPVDVTMAAPLLRALEKTVGASWSEIVRRVPSVEGVKLNHTATITLVELAAALEEGDAVMGTNDRLLCTLVGERAARDELLAAVLEEHGRLTPELFYDQIATLWTSRLAGGNARATSVGRGYGRLEVRDQLEPTLAVCACVTGLLSEALSKLGARTVEVNKTACEAVGDPACIYTATWLLRPLVSSFLQRRADPTTTDFASE